MTQKQIIKRIREDTLREFIDLLDTKLRELDRMADGYRLTDYRSLSGTQIQAQRDKIIEIKRETIRLKFVSEYTTLAELENE